MTRDYNGMFMDAMKMDEKRLRETLARLFGFAEADERDNIDNFNAGNFFLILESKLKEVENNGGNSRYDD